MLRAMIKQRPRVAGGRTVVIARLDRSHRGLGRCGQGQRPGDLAWFRVTVNNNVMGLVSNQAVVSAVGQTAAMRRGGGLAALELWRRQDPQCPDGVRQVGDPTDLAITITDNLSGQVPVPGASANTPWSSKTTVRAM